MAAIGFEMKLSKYRGRIRSVVFEPPPKPPSRWSSWSLRGSLSGFPILTRAVKTHFCRYFLADKNDLY